MIAAFLVASTALAFGFQAVANGGTRNGLPAFPFFLFGIVGLLAGGGDLRMIRNGTLKGASRIARHLWRMSFALFIAALSFFIGQAKVIPKPIRIMPLLALPVVAVLVTMLYWLWRVRMRRSLRGLVGQRVPEPA
jgi:peptidoglycan/LPS O-acetylase OafA/YrhL